MVQRRQRIASASLALSLLALPSAFAQYTATYDPNNLPDHSQEGQSGTNQCGKTASQDSMCQNAFINSVEDFCLWGPPSTHSEEGDGTSKIGNVEQNVVSYCLKDGYGTRLIPKGTIEAAHFVKVVNDKVSYVQVTGYGKLTNLLIPEGDDGGELDPHSWTGLGNPQGGLVFTNAFTGNYEETHEWTSFMSSYDFCFRACRDGPNAEGYCQHIYDVLSCGFTIPGDFGPGFDDCEGDPTDEAPGVYGGSTFHQDEGPTPAPHPPGATSQCTPYSTIGDNTVIATPSSSAPSGKASASSNSSSSGSASASTTSAVSTSARVDAVTPSPSSSAPSNSAAPASQTSGGATPGLSLGGSAIFGGLLAALAAVL